MAHETHQLKKLDLQVVVADADLAYALRPRLEALAWQQLPRVLGRVFDALLVPGEHLYLDRLDLDLGRLSPDHLEADALQALERELSEALSRALHEARQGPQAAARLLVQEQWRFEQMVDYLLTGSLAFAASPRPFDAAAQLLVLLQEQASKFTQWLRRQAGAPQVLERLVLQADAAGHRALLAHLAPADERLIWALLSDVLTLHLGLPLPRELGRAALAQVLWRTTLEFLLHDAGPSFQRAAYLEYLLRREATRLGLSYGDLLQLFAAAVAKAEQRSALHSALPAALAQLLAAQKEARAELEVSTASPARAGSPGLDPAWAVALTAAEAGEFAPLLSRLQSLREQPLKLQALAQSLGAPLLQALLRWRLPHEAQDLLGDMARLCAQSGGEVQGLLWACLLRHLMDETGQNSSRRAMQSQWLAALAQRARDPLLGLRQWLRGDGLLAAQDLQPSPAEFLLALPRPQQLGLLLCANAEHSRARVRRMLLALRPEQQLQMLHSLEPGNSSGAADLGLVLAGLGQARRFEWLMAAAEAALAGRARPPLPGSAKANRGEVAYAPAAVISAQAQTLADEAARADLLDWLEAGAPPSPARLQRLLRGLADDDQQLNVYLNGKRGASSLHGKWAAQLPSRGLHGVLALWQPEMATQLRPLLPLLQQAWRETASFAQRRSAGPLLWRSLLGLLAAPRAPQLATLMAGLITALSVGQAEQGERFRRRAQHLASRAGHAASAAALQAAAQRTASSTARKRTPEPPVLPEAPESALYIRNAGLVLLNPFLPTLFERLGLMTAAESGPPRIQGQAHASRACHLLQYLAEGRLDQAEPQLLLNKILTGQALAQPLARSHAATPQELELCDELLEVLIERWPVLKNTTPPVLRETFFQREGRLLRKGQSWTLQVQRKTLDILLDQCPWSYAIVYHPWMRDPLHINW